MNKTKKGAAAASSPTKAILIAVSELQGGDETLAHGAELTDELQKAMGLDDETIADLVARGHLIKANARVAETDGAAELAAAIMRAEVAEAEVEDLKKKLAEASKPKTAA